MASDISVPPAGGGGHQQRPSSPCLAWWLSKLTAGDAGCADPSVPSPPLYEGRAPEVMERPPRPSRISSPASAASRNINPRPARRLSITGGVQVRLEHAGGHLPDVRDAISRPDPSRQTGADGARGDRGDARTGDVRRLAHPQQHPDGFQMPPATGLRQSHCWWTP